MKKLDYYNPCTTLGLVLDLLLIVQLTVSLYRTFKPKANTTETSRDND